MSPQKAADHDPQRLPARLTAVGAAAHHCASAFRSVGASRWDHACWTAPGEWPLSADERAVLRRTAHPSTTPGR